MSKPQKKRKINRNIFDSRLYLNGLTLESLGKQLNPPISRSAVCHIIRKASPDHRLQEIAAILKTNIQTIFPKVEADSVIQHE